MTAAAAGGYLLFNFPPARIFMGDAGSSLLGYLAAALSLWASQAGYFPIWIAVLVFSPFIVDATYTLFRRLLRRERVWEAHKSHCYQRLVELGMRPQMLEVGLPQGGVQPSWVPSFCVAPSGSYVSREVLSCLAARWRKWSRLGRCGRTKFHACRYSTGCTPTLRRGRRVTSTPWTASIFALVLPRAERFQQRADCT